MTRFGKTCIFHTSDFVHLEIHKNHKQWCKDLKLSGNGSTIPESFTSICHSKEILYVIKVEKLDV